MYVYIGLKSIPNYLDLDVISRNKLQFISPTP